MVMSSNSNFRGWRVIPSYLERGPSACAQDVVGSYEIHLHILLSFIEY